MATAAWKSLSASPRALYVEIAARYNGSNNGRLSYSLREAAVELHMSKTTASRAMRDLMERGFIVPAKRGHFDRKLKHATEWRLTEFGCNLTGDLATKDFARWQAEDFDGY